MPVHLLVGPNWIIDAPRAQLERGTPTLGGTTIYGKGNTIGPTS